MTPPCKLLLISLLHGILGFTTYFYLSVLNPMEKWVKDFAQDSLKLHYNITLSQTELSWVWSFISGAYFPGQVLGAITLKYPLEHIGRKYTIMLMQNCITIIGACLQTLAVPLTSIELFIFGRFLIGIGLMQALALNLFLTECSPTECRGFVSSLPAVAKPLWLVIGGLVSLPLFGANQSNWHFVFMYPVPLAWMHLIGAFVVHESPKHLFITKKNVEEAEKAVQFYHGKDVSTAEILEQYDDEAEESTDTKSVTLLNVLAVRHLRWPLFLCVIATCTYPLSGIDIAFLYSTGIMSSAGVSNDDAQLYTVFLVQLPGFVATCISLFLLERCGRRPLFLIGFGASVFGISLLSLNTPSALILEILGNLFCVAGFFLVYFGYTFALLLIEPIIAGELVPQSARSLAFSTASTVGFSMSMIIAFSFPTLNAINGSYAAMPMALLAMMAWTFMWKFLPETKGKTVNEVIEVFKKWKTMTFDALFITFNNKYFYNPIRLNRVNPLETLDLTESILSIFFLKRI